MNRKHCDKNFFSLLILFLITLKVFAVYQQKRGSESQIPKGCSQMKCATGQQCVTRKFWCKNPPCPHMLYCSKSRKESLKGPSSCSSVHCSKGYVCLVRVRQCTWNDCRQQIARCVTEREYYEGPASCADFQCPEGHKCILRESLCVRPPCKVLKSCARNADAENWFKKCKELGCTSKYECFLRRPMEKCERQPCKHTPDCMLPLENVSNENCRGWVCPVNHECLARVLGPCKQNICKVSRSCKAPLDNLNNRSKPELKTLTELEKNWFYQEEEKRRLQVISTTTVAPIVNKESPLQNSGYDKARQLFFKQGESPVGVQGHNYEFLNSAWSVPNFPSVPIYKYPTYVVSTVKPKQIFSPEKTTAKVITTTASPPSWLKSLKSRTSMDVINFWVKKAEQNQNYVEFQQWLQSVREYLDPEMYRLWLEGVRSTTTYNKHFQDWLPLPLPVPSYNFNIPHFSNFGSKISNMEDEVLSAFPAPKFDEPYGIPGVNDVRNTLTTTTTSTIKKSSSDNSDIQTFLSSSTFNTSTNNSELEKGPVIPTFIIIQTPPQTLDQNFLYPQKLMQHILDPRFIARLNPYQQFQQFQLTQPLDHNFMTPHPIYPHLLQNNFLQGKSAFPFSRWLNLLNSFSKENLVIPQMNQNLIPPNYLHQYLLSLQGHMPFYQWNHAGFGYPNFHPTYHFNMDDRPVGIYDQKEDNFEIPESNFSPRRRDYWREYFEKGEKNDDYNEGEDKYQRSKADRLRYQRKPTSGLDKNPDFVDDKEKQEQEIQEQEIQFIKQIIQGILDHDLDGNGEKKEKEKERKTERKREKETENEKNRESEREKEKKKEKETEIYENDILMESLIHTLLEQLEDSLENTSDPKLETLIDETEKEGEKDTKLLEDEFHRFHENFAGPLLRRRKGDAIFRSPRISQDSLTFPKNKTLERTKMEETSPEIIVPKASYYDFAKNSDLIRNPTSDKNSLSVRKEMKIAEELEKEKKIYETNEKNVKESNVEDENDE